MTETQYLIDQQKKFLETFEWPKGISEEAIERVKSQQRPAGKNSEMFTVGNQLWGKCPACMSLVRINKPILGSMHFCAV